MSKKEKIALVTPGYLPVPAVNGGAVETLITYIIDSNEKNHLYDIDLYTVSSQKNYGLSNYKYTNIVPIKTNRVLSGIIFRIINRVLKIMKINYVLSSFRKKCTSLVNKKEYDKIIVENNAGLYKRIYRDYSKKHKNTQFYFHLHNDIGGPDKSIKDAKFIANTANEIIFVSKNWFQERCSFV